MGQQATTLAAGLQQAIQAEIDGYHFYLMAARSTDDEKGKEVLQQLAQEELEHARFLKAQYQSVITTGSVDGSVRLGKGAELTGPSPIFSEGFRSRLGEAHFEMSALSIGIQLELSAQKFYRDQSQAFEDPFVQQFYQELADWEATHYQALLRQQEALKEDYWAQGGFSPF
ncbi:MAG: ferritin family protein [Bradymonadales bacterium]|nr:ferritin family protein [Bradymonadales bacterium]